MANDVGCLRRTGCFFTCAPTTDCLSTTPKKYKRRKSPGDACVICLREMKNDNMTYLRCGHAMHDDCFKECKQYTKNCPMCRQQIHDDGKKYSSLYKDGRYLI
nr:E3 ubiquitin-protein ligase MPSR1 isoform X2 [Bactrocera oleae]